MSAEDLSDAAQKARDLLAGLLERMGFEATVEAGRQEEDEILLRVATPEASLLIGRGAETLDALQCVVSRMALRGVGAGYRVRVDVEGYRERRRERLVSDAREAADVVRRTGREVEFPPMPAAERRIVHQALRDEPGLETVSRGEDERGRKSVAVVPTAAPPPAGAHGEDEAEPDVDDIIER